jgi:hypothetical protein
VQGKGQSQKQNYADDKMHSKKCLKIIAFFML